MKQIRTLMKIELCNLFGWNVFKHTKDKSAKRRSIVLAAAMGVLLGIVMFYVVGLSYGLVMLGAADIIPAYLIMISSIVVLMFGIFKAGGVIFRKKGYDIISSLPISNRTVVLSRFFRLYIENLILIAVVMLPGMITYGVLVHPQIAFYIVGILSILVIPFIPVTIASAVGAVITGIASRMKHKALTEAGLSILLIVIIFIGSFGISENSGEFTTEMIQNLANIVMDLIGKIYPPAVILGNAIVQGDFANFLFMAVVSVIVFGVVAFIVSAKFDSICSSLYATSAKHNYQMKEMEKNSIQKALIVREARRYFSSEIYVTNTIMGPVLGVAFCIGLFFFNPEEITAGLPVALNVKAAIPYFIAAIFNMMNVTSTSISMEGKEFWIVKSLPLDTKMILDSKLLFNLCLLAPFYFVSEILAVIALRPSILELVWLILIPALLCLCACVFGITANLLFPKLDWENETTVVKQSASAAIGGMSGVVASIPCMFAVLCVPERVVNGINGAICILLVLIAVALYRRNNKFDLKSV